jgi:transposase
MSHLSRKQNSKQRRRWTAERKLQIVLETLQSDRKLAEICRREGVSPNLVYQWRKLLLGSAEAVFGRKPKVSADRQTERLTVENARMKSVIAEITAENLELKKSCWTERPRSASGRAATRGDSLGIPGQTTQRLARLPDPEGPGDSAGQLLSLEAERPGLWQRR